MIGSTRNNMRKVARRSGAAAVEAAIVLPLLFYILMGIWEVGRLVELQQILVTAARQAAREASTGSIYAEVQGGNILKTDAIQPGPDRLYSDISTFLTNNGVNTTNLKIAFANLGSAPLPPPNLPAGFPAPAAPAARIGIVTQVPYKATDTLQGDLLQLTVSVKYKDNAWFLDSLPKLPNGGLFGFFTTIVDPATTVSATSVFPCTKDLPVVVSFALPGG